MWRVHKNHRRFSIPLLQMSFSAGAFASLQTHLPRCHSRRLKSPGLWRLGAFHALAGRWGVIWASNARAAGFLIRLAELPEGDLGGRRPCLCLSAAHPALCCIGVDPIPRPRSWSQRPQCGPPTWARSALPDKHMPARSRLIWKRLHDRLFVRIHHASNMGQRPIRCQRRFGRSRALASWPRNALQLALGLRK